MNPPVPAVPTAGDLPPAEGVWGCVQHTWAALKLQRVWRQQQQQLGDALNAAVQVRDTRLVALGEDALAAPEHQTAILAFKETLDGFSEKLNALELQQQGLDQTRATTITSRDTQLAAHAQAVLTAQQNLAPQERRLTKMVSQLADAEQELTAREGQLRSLRNRLEHLPEAAESENEDSRLLQEKMESLSLKRTQLIEKKTRLQTPVLELRSLVQKAARTLEAARDARRLTHQTSTADLERLDTQSRQLTHTVETIERQRRAVLIDLGRSALDRSLPLPTLSQAHAAISHIKTLRAAYAHLETERASFDGTAVRRTLWVGVALIALLLFWALW